MKYCEECGAAMEDDALFCEECGTKCAAQTENGGVQKKKNSNIAIIAVLAILVLAFGGVGIYFLNSGDGKKKGEVGDKTVYPTEDSQVQLGKTTQMKGDLEIESEPQLSIEPTSETEPESESESEAASENEPQGDVEDYSSLIPEGIRADEKFVYPSGAYYDEESNCWCDIYLYDEEDPKSEYVGQTNISVGDWSTENVELISLKTNIYAGTDGENIIVIGVYYDDMRFDEAMDVYINGDYVGNLLIEQHW